GVVTFLTNQKLSEDNQLPQHQVDEVYYGAGLTFPAAGAASLGTPDLVLEPSRPVYASAVSTAVRPYLVAGAVDLNGDGIDDYLVSGPNTSYLLLGPVTLDNVQSIADRAGVVFDAASLGHTAARTGDVNGDGLADLVFYRLAIAQDNTTQLVVTVIF